MKTLARQDCRTEILRRLRTLRADSAARWGHMSAHQMVCHLADACRMATGDKAVARARPPLPPALMKWIALYLPLPWPAGVPTTPEIDQQCGGTRPADFAADVAQLETLLTALVTRDEQLPWPPHPYFGSMSAGDWLRWGYLHASHHLRQFGT